MRRDATRPKAEQPVGTRPAHLGAQRRQLCQAGQRQHTAQRRAAAAPPGPGSRGREEEGSTSRPDQGCSCVRKPSLPPFPCPPVRQPLRLSLQQLVKRRQQRPLGLLLRVALRGSGRGTGERCVGVLSAACPARPSLRTPSSLQRPSLRTPSSLQRPSLRTPSSLQRPSLRPGPRFLHHPLSPPPRPLNSTRRPAGPAGPS